MENREFMDHTPSTPAYHESARIFTAARAKGSSHRHALNLYAYGNDNPVNNIDPQDIAFDTINMAITIGPIHGFRRSCGGYLVL